jgi:hypothetical protein
MATREEKVRKKQERSLRRIQKRQNKDYKYIERAGTLSRGISWARRKSKGLIFECEMGYSGCELRGYCNGDC